MGRVRVGVIKRAAKEIIEKYYSRLTYDFHSNKRVADEVDFSDSVIFLFYVKTHFN